MFCQKPNPKNRLKSKFIGLLAALNLATFPALSQPVNRPIDLLQTMGQRQYLLEADRRCHFLDKPAQAALTAGFLQARNAAIRSKISSEQIMSVINRANQLSQNSACDDITLRGQINTLKSAFLGFNTQINLDLKGNRSSWRAIRAYDDDEIWRLVQYQRGHDLTLAFGLYGTTKHKSLSVMAQFNRPDAPYSARILVRNTMTTLNGIINTDTKLLSKIEPFGYDTSRAVSFVAMRRSQDERYLGLTKKVNEAGYNLLGERVDGSAKRLTQRFDFPSSVIKAIGPLDPREDIVVVFDFADGPQYARFEVGDFISGLIYTGLPSPYTNAKPNRAL